MEKGAALRTLFIAANILMLSVMHACAQHPPEHRELHEKFYKNWMMPDNRNSSCCSEHDCYPTEAKMVNGTWLAKRREDGEWLQVPADKVETERDNPDGRNHLCAPPPGRWVYVFCFIPGGGT